MYVPVVAVNDWKEKETRSLKIEQNQAPVSFPSVCGNNIVDVYIMKRAEEKRLNDLQVTRVLTQTQLRRDGKDCAHRLPSRSGRNVARGLSSRPTHTHASGEPWKEKRNEQPSVAFSLLRVYWMCFMPFEWSHPLGWSRLAYGHNFM